MAARLFESDRDYLDWVARHPLGFVVNTRRRVDPRYMVLHTATCRSICSPAVGLPAGAFTQRGYRKVCAGSIDDLRSWTEAHGRSDGSFSSHCSLCSPLAGRTDAHETQRSAT